MSPAPPPPVAFDPAALMSDLMTPLAQVAGPDYFGWVVVAAMMGATLFAVGRASRRG